MNGLHRKPGRGVLVPGVTALVLSLGVWMPACSAQAKKMDAKMASDDSAVLATIGDQSITAGEVKTKSVEEFKQLDLQWTQFKAEWEKRKHETLENSTRTIVRDSLVEKEAAAKNMTKETYLASAIPTPEISDADVDKFYEENKARIPPQMTKEQVVPQIKNYLAQQQQVEARDKFMTELEAKYNVKYLIEPMRATVAAKGPSKGPESAPVQLVIFSDFECPFCSRLVPTVDEVVSKYGDKVRVAFRQFPLSIHPNAPKAAEASLCADEQGKFWPMHDELFKDQKALAVDSLKTKAAALGVNAEQFNACLDSGKYAKQVADDMQEGAEAGVSGTPAMFVNGRFLSGAVPFADVAKLIDDELARKGVK